MRAALRVKVQPRTQSNSIKTLPAPVGGWNARDAFALMNVKDAVALDNFFPRQTDVELRGGYTPHTEEVDTSIITEAGLDILTETGDILATENIASTMTGNAKTLMTYNAKTGNSKLFASTETGIYDVSTAGPVGAIALARTNAKHQWINFGDGTNTWLIAVNGVDKPAYYDGTTWTAVDAVTSPALTGLTTTDIIGVTKHKGRLYFIQKAELKFWYLPAGVAGGALTSFDISSDAKRGGFLMAMHGWSRDAGDGQDDVMVCVTSEGEALVYQGNNPAVAANWALVGSFFVGKPLGRRCLTQMGGDLILITENGAWPISTAMLTAAVSNEKALSDKIVKAFTAAARTYGDIFGWEAVIFNAQNALIVNVPLQEDGTHHQYVMNTQTKSWCRFIGWDAETFCVFNKELYFARGNTVYKAWTGTEDGNAAINWFGKQAYSQMGVQGLKRPVLFRPVLSTNGNLGYSAAIDVDFQDPNLAHTTVETTTTLPLWGTMVWGNFIWSGSGTLINEWGSTSSHPGYWLAGKIKGSTNNSRIQWMASDMMYEAGAGL
jgi:hypothetical protein